jgi:Protein of unknown function (DUF3263)
MRRAADDAKLDAADLAAPDEVDLGAEDAPPAPVPPAPRQRAPEQKPPGDSDAALSERDCRILDFERRWWRHAGSKEQAVREQFQLSATRYYQVLNGLLDSAAALEYDPVLVKRLRRLRATRARTRTAGRSG